MASGITRAWICDDSPGSAELSERGLVLGLQLGGLVKLEVELFGA
jgi:hypothetical protein